MDGDFQGVTKSADYSRSNILIRLGRVFMMYTSHFVCSIYVSVYDKPARLDKHLEMTDRPSRPLDQSLDALGKC